jgi:hypothetical protein
MTMNDSNQIDSPRTFATTHWSVVLVAGHGITVFAVGDFDFHPVGGKLTASTGAADDAGF